MSEVFNMVGGGASGPPRYYLIKDSTEQNGALVSVGKKSASSSPFSAEAPELTRTNTGITIGFSATASSGKQGIVYFNAQSDLSQFTKVCAKGRFVFASSSSFNSLNMATCAWTSIGTYSSDNRLYQLGILGAAGDNVVTTDQTGTLEFDITSYSSSAYVGFNFAHATQGYGFIVLTDLWLE